MSTFGQDSMTGAATTLLSAHTPEIGGSWAIATGTTATLQLTNANRLRPTTASAEGDYLCQGTPATADYDVSLDLFVASNTVGSYAGVLGRSDASAGTNASTGKAYEAFYDNSSGTQRWGVQKAVNNAFTLLASSAATLTVSSTYTMRLQMRGTALTLFVNGVSTVATTDSAVTAKAQAGLFVAGPTPANTTDYHVDNFAADDFAVALAPHAWHNPLLPM